MSVQKIIQESINKNPLALKEALEEELRSRVALALEAKVAESNDNDDEDCDDDEDDGMDESFDLSDYTVEELEDFMMSEEFEQLDELDKKTLASYVKKAAGAGKEGMAYQARAMTQAAQPDTADKADYKKSQRKVNNRSTGIQRAADRLAK